MVAGLRVPRFAGEREVGWVYTFWETEGFHYTVVNFTLGTTGNLV